MDPEEELAALQQQQPQQPQGGSNYDGRIAVNPQTGERVIYRISPGGRGRFVALNSETADPQSRERVANLQNMVTIGQRTMPLAQRFVQRNFETQTGGIQNSPTMNPSLRSALATVRPNMFNDADELRGLSSQMVGSNWQPGTTGMFNTATEQEMIRQRFPSPTNLGRANMDVYLNMAEDVAAQQAALTSMRQWLTRHANLDGWEQEFTRQEPGIRQRARHDAWQGMSDYSQRRNGTQRSPIRAAPQQRAPAPQQRAPAPAPVQSRQGGPRAGDVEDGYRFRGGDPSNPQNWERVR